MKLPSPIRWIGGKSRLLKHILPLIEPHPGESVFVDCFGGSGVVTLNKTRHPSETYNDMNGDLVNLFRVIRDPDGVVHLWWELINTPNSREEFRDSIPNEKFSPLTPVQRAARFVIQCRQAFGGGGHPGRQNTERNWGTARGSSRGINDSVARWFSVMMELPRIHRRMIPVVVDQQDALRCIRQWDGPSTLFYCDPPYVGKEDCYSVGDESLHARLAEALNHIQGRAVLSYYDHPTVANLYPEASWTRTRVCTRVTACGNTKRDPNGPPSKQKNGTARVELILTNFDRKTRKRLS